MNVTLQRKRTTRNIKPSYVVNRKTIDTQHAEYMGSMQARAKQLADITDVIADKEKLLCQLLASDVKDHARIVELKDQLLDMKRDSAKLENDGEQYFINTANILFKYYDIVDNVNGAGGGGQTTYNVTNGSGGQPPTPGSNNNGNNGNGNNNGNNNNNGNGEAENSILRYFSKGAEVAGGGGGGRGQPPAKVATSSEPPLPLKKKEAEFEKQRGSLLEEYMECTSDNYIKTCILGDVIMVCQHCNSSNNTVIQNDGYMMCNSCNTIEYVIVDHEKPSYKDPPKEISYYAYKRLNHFNEWLNQVQGKEMTDIPDDIFDNIMLEIKKQKVKNMATLTQAHVRCILKKLKLTKYFEHVPYITCRLNGLPMPQLSPELEDKLRNMFRQIQAPFVKHSPPERKNFLSYSYVIHKFLLLLGHDEYLHCFPLLRDKSKNYASEVLFKKICEELNWQFIRSI